MPVYPSHRRTFGSALALLTVILPVSCSSPETEEGFQRFLHETEDMRGSADGPVLDGVEGDFSGDYFLAVETPLGGPLFFETTVLVRATDGGSVIDLSFQPLKSDLGLDGGPREDARVPVGEAVVATDIPLAEGAFEVEILGFAVPADANPVTYTDIVADLTFTGVVLSLESFCGTISGTLTIPLEVDLAGSTFGAVQTEDPGAEPVVVRCPEGGGADAGE